VAFEYSSWEKPRFKYATILSDVWLCLMLIFKARTAAHVPDITTWEGVLDLLALCSLMELLNVVDASMYLVASSKLKYDSPLKANPGMSARHRLECIAARQASREMLGHFFSHFEIVNTDGKSINGVDDVWWPYFARQLVCLENLKCAAWKGKISGAKDCTYMKFMQQVQFVYEGFPREFVAICEQLKNDQVDNFAWPRALQYSIRPLVNPRSDIRCEVVPIQQRNHS
jgi:hypothetical protein